ncbi:Uncharacterized protein FWK35_00008118 [Aphis craccivora]|uniref:Uncharacterized protein n=1 Tax=Aphis craccivora TaxID=307492 RepID=A0A6G0YIH4_APHCR|nr:Uncharacterized protein FWK35_00008118 [Aphis craccivora]
MCNILSGAMNVLILQCYVFFLDSERCDECIDFTMMCVFFFVSVYTVHHNYLFEIMLQFQTMGVVSDIKVNILGAL